MGMSASDLAGMQTTVSDFLPDTGTITRTGASVACRITADNTTLTHLPQLPTAINVRRWTITVLNTASVLPGDVLTVPGMGTYTILAPDAPADYSPDIVCQAVMTRTATGGWPVVTNASVQFRNPRKPSLAPITASAFVHPLSMDPRLGDADAQFTYQVVFDPQLTYSDGSSVAANHEIIWSGLRTPRHAAILGHLRVTLTPLPYTTAGFKEQD